MDYRKVVQGMTPILTLLLTASLLSSCGSGKVDQTSPPASNEAAIQNKQIEEVAQQVPINFRERAYTVKRAVVAKTFGNDYNTVTAQDGWTYLVVEYTVQNTTAETVDLGYDDMAVTTDDGRIFEPDSEAGFKIESALGKQLHPGATKSRTLVYQLPLDALQKHPLFHIGQMEGGWSFAAVPLTDWHGEVYFQPGSEHYGNQAPKPSENDSEVFIVKAKSSDSLKAFDCPATAKAWENLKETHHANWKGLLKRCLMQSLDSQEAIVLERDGDYVRVEVLDGMDKARNGWIPSKYLSSKTVETSSDDQATKPLEAQESKPLNSSETKASDVEESTNSNEENPPAETAVSPVEESKQEQRPAEKAIDQFKSE